MYLSIDQKEMIEASSIIFSFIFWLITVIEKSATQKVIKFFFIVNALKLSIYKHKNKKTHLSVRLNISLWGFLSVSIKEEIFLKKFGSRVRELRKENGFSQFELAIECGVPKNQIGRIERAEINTSLKTILKISEALQIKPVDLFKD